MLCDIEWDTPVGEAESCGGIAMMRAGAFEGVQGFRADLTVGEEPELCVRLRAAGWRIRRLGDEMALHDAAMTRLGQWWVRSLRCGYAFAQGSHLHGALPERYRVRESYSAWFWGLAVPLGILGFVWWLGEWALLLMLIYPLQIVRLAVRGRRSTRENWLHAGFLVLGKFPEMLGQIRFLIHRILGRQSSLMEYK
jgi:GT2 family glycosyltransferase